MEHGVDHPSHALLDVEEEALHRMLRNDPLRQRPIDSDERVPYFDYETQNPIEIRQGCVLIPIAFAVWWYWTRRAARKAVRLLLHGGRGDSCFAQEAPNSAGGEPCVNTSQSSSDLEGEDVDSRVPMQTRYDKFDTWDDVLAQESTSAHMVRWITSEKRRTAKRRMRAVTRAVMNRSSLDDSGIALNVTTNDENIMPPEQHQQRLSNHCEGLLPSCDDAFSVSTSACSNWECIDDTVIDIATPKRLADAIQEDKGVLV